MIASFEIIMDLFNIDFQALQTQYQAIQELPNPLINNDISNEFVTQNIPNIALGNSGTPFLAMTLSIPPTPYLGPQVNQNLPNPPSLTLPLVQSTIAKNLRIKHSLYGP